LTKRKKIKNTNISQKKIQIKNDALLQKIFNIEALISLHQVLLKILISKKVKQIN